MSYILILLGAGAVLLALAFRSDGSFFPLFPLSMALIFFGAVLIIPYAGASAPAESSAEYAELAVEYTGLSNALTDAALRKEMGYSLSAYTVKVKEWNAGVTSHQDALEGPFGCFVPAWWEEFETINIDDISF